MNTTIPNPPKVRLPQAVLLAPRKTLGYTAGPK